MVTSKLRLPARSRERDDYNRNDNCKELVIQQRDKKEARVMETKRSDRDFGKDHHSETVNFVITLDNRLGVGKDSKKGRHADIARGLFKTKDAQYAGTLIFSEDGRSLQTITNSSGHFLPTKKHADDAAQWFRKRNFPVNKVTYV